MTSITQTQRYIPHELNTKFYAVNLYRHGYPVSFVCRRYKISKSSLIGNLIFSLKSNSSSKLEILTIYKEEKYIRNSLTY